MLTNDDVSRAMDDIARMAAQAGVLTQRFEEPSSADQATLLEQILLVDRLGSTRIAHRKNLKIGVAALGLAASLAIGVAVIEQQGASGPFRADTPGATATDSAQSRPKGPATLGPYLSIPETPTEWLVGQVGKLSLIHISEPTRPY